MGKVKGRSNGEHSAKRSSEDQGTSPKEFLTGTAGAAGVAGAAAVGITSPALGARSSKPKEIVVVGSKVKEVIREAGLRSDGELVQAVSDKVHEVLGAASKRCTSNGRSTVRPYDL